MKPAGQTRPPTALPVSTAVPAATTPTAEVAVLTPAAAVPVIDGVPPGVTTPDCFVAGPAPEAAALITAPDTAGGPVIARPEETVVVVTGTNRHPSHRFIRNEKGDKKYEIIGEPIAAGSQAVIYLVRGPDGQTFVAKELKDPINIADPVTVERLLKEAEILTKVKHPNLVVCHDYFVSIDERGNRRLTLIEDHVRGKTLATIISAGPQLERDIITIGLQIAGVIELLDENGFHHRDINPDNVMISGTGRLELTSDGIKTDEGKLLATVLDLGLAKDTRIRTREGSIGVGTLYWMPPEQLRGQTQEISMPTDIYALGLVLIAMATGRPRTGFVIAEPPAADLAALRAGGQYSTEFIDALQMMTDDDPAVRLDGLKLLKELATSPAKAITPRTALVRVSAEKAIDRAVASAVAVSSTAPLTEGTWKIIEKIDYANVFFRVGPLTIPPPPLGRRRLSHWGQDYIDLSRKLKLLEKEIRAIEKMPHPVDAGVEPARDILRDLSDYRVEGKRRNFGNVLAQLYLTSFRVKAETNPKAAQILALFHEFAPEIVSAKVLATLPIRWSVDWNMGPKFIRTLFDNGNEGIKRQVNSGYRDYLSSVGARRVFLEFGANEFEEGDLVQTVLTVENYHEAKTLLEVDDHSEKADIDEVRTLIKRGAPMKWAALEAAIKSNRADLVELFLRHGYAPDDEHRTSVLSDAKEGTSPKIIRALVMKEFEFARTDSEKWRKSVGHAIETNDKEFALKLIRTTRRGNDENEANLLYSWATEKGHADIVSLLMEKDYNPYEALCKAVFGGFPEVVRVILASGRHVNKLNSSELTIVLKIAARLERSDVLRLLIEDHAHLTGSEGQDALSAALSDRRFANAQLLIDNRVDVTGEVGAEWLLKAAETNDMEMAEFLIDRKVDIRGVNGGAALINAATSGYPTQMLEFLIDRRVDFQKHGGTAAARAAEKNYTEPVRVLLARGWEPDTESAVKVAKSAVDHDNFEMIKLLLDAKADIEGSSYPINRPPYEGPGPLIFYAAIAQKWEIVEELLTHGRNVDSIMAGRLLDMTDPAMSLSRGELDQTRWVFDRLVRLGFDLPKGASPPARERAREIKAEK